MKNIKVLVFLFNLSVAFSLTNYCELEKRVCGKSKHIGCEKNVIFLKLLNFCYL